MTFCVPIGRVIGVGPANQLSRFGNCVYTRLLTGPASGLVATSNEVMVQQTAHSQNVGVPAVVQFDGVLRDETAPLPKPWAPTEGNHAN